MLSRSSALVLWAMACASSIGAGNLIENPSFERDRNRDGLPDGWTRVYNEKLSGPCRLVDDPHEGRRAVQFETEEWNYLRPNLLAQEVKLPKNAAFACLSVYAKGRGLVSLCVRFLKDGRPVEEKTIDMGFGPEKIPAEIRNDFALELDCSRYEALYEVPKGANGAQVLLGNTAGLLDRLNVWGRCTLDDVSFVAGTRKELGKLAGEGEAPAELRERPLAVAGPLKNIAPFARIRLEPPSFDARALTDGDVKSTAAFYPGPERGGIVRLVFPKAAPVKMLKLHLNGAAGSYSVRGDKDGDGAFETPILRTQGLAGLTGWKTHVLPGDAFQALQIQALSGTDSAWAFRQTNPFLTEIEVQVPADSVSDAELKDWRANTFDYPLAGGFAAIEAKPEPLTLPKAKGHFHKMACADLWVWGIDYKRDVKKGTWTKEKIRANKTFQENAQIAREMGCDTIFIDLTNSTCWDLMPWPSRVCKGVEDNILKALIDALHEEGLRVVTEVLHNFTPFEPIKWHYPCEETSRYPAMRQFPSILYGGHVRDNWLKVYEEMADCGADGVCLGSDEFYYRGHFLRTLPENDAQRQFYEKTHTRKVPAREADTLDYRLWVRDTEEGLAGLFTYWNAELRKKHPNLYTCSVFMQPVQRSNLYGEGTPFDLIGQKSGIDEIGGDYYEPWGIRMLSAANGWRKVSHLFWGWFEAKDAPINLTARPLWMLMYGGGSANYWRFYQLKESGHWKSVQKGYAMADDLEALGVWEAKPPHDIAVLSSRESWDWWQVRSYYGPLPKPTADRAIEAMRGWFSDELVNDRILIKNGYSYDWYFADHPKHIEQLDGYKVILLPFAYSVSDAAAAKVKEAARKGAKVILFGTLGETDEWGQPRATPALKELVDSGQATLVSDDLLEAGADDRFVAKVHALIDGALGDKQPFKLNRYGKRIDATLLAKSGRERFVFVINWEEKPATVDLSVGVPEGNYRVMMRDDAQWNKVALGGKDVLTAPMLRKLRRLVPAQKAEVYYLCPVEK